MWICAQGFDLLLGSDVAYSLKALPSLFKAASLLLSKQPHSIFLLGYVSRSEARHTLSHDPMHQQIHPWCIA